MCNVLVSLHDSFESRTPILPIILGNRNRMNPNKPKTPIQCIAKSKFTSYARTRVRKCKARRSRLYCLFWDQGTRASSTNAALRSD